MNQEELRKEESERAEYLKEGMIEQLQEHVRIRDLQSLEDWLRNGLTKVEEERKKLRILAIPLP